MFSKTMISAGLVVLGLAIGIWWLVEALPAPSDPRLALSECRRVCAVLPGGAKVTFRKDEGIWRTRSLDCFLGATDSMLKTIARVATLESTL